MDNKLRILILEDFPADVELIEYELKKAKIAFVSKQVETRKAYTEELKNFKPDIILADYSLPSFDGFSALKIAQNKCPEVPFIFISGTVGEDIAIEALKKGATDYVLKDRLSRFAPCVRRALLETEERNMRKRAEEALQKAYSELEIRVQQRTAELSRANEDLTKEISERRRVEEELRRSEERFRSLVQSLPDIVYRLDGNGHFIFINNSIRSLGFNPDELLGNHFKSIIHPEDVNRVSRSAVLPQYEGRVTGPEKAPKLFDERRTGKRMTRDLEVRLISKNGNGVMVGSVFSWGEIISIGLYDRDVTREDKVFLGTVGIIRDITERKRAEEALQKAYGELELRVQERTAELIKINKELSVSNAELEQFVYVSSHDLQEPLRKIASYTQLLEERYKGKLDGDADKFINYVVDGAVRMQTLIKDLLAYSRVGREELSLEQTNFNALMKQTLEDMEASIRESGAEVMHDPLPSLMANPSQINHLLQNLISNAIKFRSKEPPRIHVSAEKKNGEWVFSIRDNGIGIEPQYAERIFIIFQKLHSRGEYPGNGIGLAVCKKIVERHGGRIWVDSQIGCGAAFFFTIPENKTPEGR